MLESDYQKYKKRYEVYQIVKRTDHLDESKIKESRKLLETLSKDIEDLESFIEAAKKYSDDITAKDGGYIGKIRLGKSQGVTFIEGRINVGVTSGVPLISEIVNKYINSDELNIVDSSPGTSCPVVESIKKSDYVLLVTEPTPFGMSDLKLTIEIVRDLDKKASIVVNKDTKSKMIDDYAQSVNIPVVMKIPYSIEIQRSYSKGIPLIEVMPEMKKGFTDLIKKLG